MVKRRDQIAAATSVCVVLIVVALGFFLSGSPEHQRMLGADARRTDDLSVIALRLHASFAAALPANLSELASASDLRLADRVTGTPYEYHRGPRTSYSICANFSLPTPADELPPQQVFWHHPAGRYCYSLDSSQQPPPHTPDYRVYQ
ncbi:MAG TPA: hypothetical protein VGR73_01355 [Bryobacteraceae bacterium]|nr:hypothetical protein [Bryobacteraceae bacterium]